MRQHSTPLTMTMALLFPTASAHAGTYALGIDAQTATPAAIVHPLGYTGQGGLLTVPICIVAPPISWTVG
jgi:hypothetical protein